MIKIVNNHYVSKNHSSRYRELATKELSYKKGVLASYSKRRTKFLEDGIFRENISDKEWYKINK